MSEKLVYLICLVLALGLALTSTASAADPSLVGWWRLDDGSGNSAVDSSDYGNHGTLNGDPQWVPGKLGGALQLDGVDDFVEVPHAQSLTADNEVTVMLWLNAERIGSGAGGDYGGLITKGSGARAYNFYMNAPNKLHFSVGPAGGWVHSWSTGTFVTNEWTHVVAQVVDGHQQYYINGQDAGTAGEGTTLPGASATEPLYIGRAPEGTYSRGMFDDVRIYNRALSQQEIQEVMKGASPGSARNLSPADNATDMLLDTDVSWEPGEFAVSHDVYFGESLEDVNTATLGDDAFQVNQTANTFDPGALAYDKTYFWRIDEVNDADPNSPWKGETWSFATEPYLFTLPAACIDVDASSYDSNDTLPENTINGSGLDESGLLHSDVESTMWVTAADGPEPAWIEFTFDKDYALYEMDVWNHNGLLGLFGIQEALIEISTDGAEYTTLGTYTFTKAPGISGYAANTTVDLGGLIASKVRITAQSGYLDAINVGLSEVQFRYLPVRAYDLTLADGTAGVPVDETLGWRAGRQAVVHEIWLGADADDLALVDTVSETQYNPGSLDLTLGQTYYYQIVEVNEAETPARWATDPVSFTVADALVVDDMESYNDLSQDAEGSRRIYNIWTDGYGDGTNGSQLGRPEDPLTAPFVEQTLVKSGKQAMSLLYDNRTAPKSEVTAATADLGVVSDWTSHGIKSLNLWFHGDPDNAPQQLYVTINGVKVRYDGDAENLTPTGWQTWTIDLSDRAVANVSAIGIGLERISGTGGSGVLYVDDLRLYPYERQFVTPAEPSSAGLVGHWKLDEASGLTASDSSGSGNNGTLTDMVGTEWATGILNGALRFDGLRDYVEVPDSPSLDITEAITLAAWVKPESTGAARWLIAKEAWGADQAYGLNLSDGGQVEFGIATGTAWIFKPVPGETTQTISDGTWSHVVGQYSPPYIKIFINGQLSQEWDIGSHPINTNDNNLLIGTMTKADQRYSGLADDIRIYDRALTPDEIAWLAGVTKPFDKPF